MKKTLTTLLLAPMVSPAALIWTGQLNVPIPPATGPGAGLDGVYLDIENGSSQTTADDSFALTQVNFFAGGFAMRSSADFLPARSGTGSSDAILKLLPGGTVNSALDFSAQVIGTSDAHVGLGVDQFQSGEEGFLGFQFTEGDGSDHFGWMRVTLTNNGQGLIHEWAYNDTAGEAIQVGAIIPEPSSLLLIGAGSLGLLIRRSRQR